MVGSVPGLAGTRSLRCPVYERTGVFGAAAEATRFGLWV